MWKVWSEGEQGRNGGCIESKEGTSKERNGVSREKGRVKACTRGLPPSLPPHPFCERAESRSYTGGHAWMEDCTVIISCPLFLPYGGS